MVAVILPYYSKRSNKLENQNYIQSWCIIKNGTNEKITIHGKDYQEKMPGFPELADIDVAQVMVYVTNSFGNHQGFVPYSKVSTQLQNCR